MFTSVKSRERLSPIAQRKGTWWSATTAISVEVRSPRLMQVSMLAKLRSLGTSTTCHQCLLVYENKSYVIWYYNLFINNSNICPRRSPVPNLDFMPPYPHFEPPLQLFSPLSLSLPTLPMASRWPLSPPSSCLQIIR